MLVSLKSAVKSAALLGLLFAVPACTLAQTTSRVSLGPGGLEGNDDSFDSRVSADGRFVVFRSFATNLVAGDTNNQADIFVTELATGVTERVNVSTAGVQANGISFGHSISGDGRYIVFNSIASNLVSGDTNAAYDIFVRDTVSDTTTRISNGTGGAQSNGSSIYPTISQNGRYIAYESIATNLVSGDTNNQRDIFLHDTTTATTTRLSVTSTGGQTTAGSQEAIISGDGSTVAFYSTAADLVTGDTNISGDVFVRNIAAGTTILASRATDGTLGNSASGSSDIALSFDGTLVAFESGATNLVTGDTNGFIDVFVRDLTNSTTTRVSVTSGGVQTNDESFVDAITSDNKYIVFDSFASNLVTGDTNDSVDVFVYDRAAAATYRVSLGAGDVEGNDESSFADISADGSVLVFEGYGTNLVANDTNEFADIFVRRPLNLPAALVGTLNLQGIAPTALNQTLTFTFRTGGVDTVRTVSVPASGAFSIAGLSRANYNVLISGGSYLSKLISADLSTGSVLLPSPVLLRTGDATRDNAADIADLTLLITAYNKISPATGYDSRVDFNLDGANDISDLLLLIGNYNTLGDTLP